MCVYIYIYIYIHIYIYIYIYIYIGRLRGPRAFAGLARAAVPRHGLRS